MVLKQYPKVLRWNSTRRQEKGFTPIEEIEGIVYIQEKLDGSNFRAKLTDNGWVFGSKKYIWEEDEEIGKQFRQASKYIEEKVDIEKLRKYQDEHGQITLFMENCVLHNISYNFENMNIVYGFDAYSHKKQEFIEIPKMEKIMENIGIPTVPLLKRIKASEIDWENFEVPKSYFRDGKAEGVVVKNPSTNIKAKVVHPSFSEHNSMSFGFSKSTADSDEERAIGEFCPNIRIIKQLQKQVNEEGRELTMADMMGDAQVHTKILMDMWEEEYASIVHKNWELDMNKLKKLVTDRARKVLKRRINIKERNNLTDQEALSMRWDEE